MGKTKQKSAYFYILFFDDNYIKIGYSTYLQRRLGVYKSSNHHSFEVIYTGLHKDANIIETKWRKMLSSHKVVGRLDWFKMDKSEFMNIWNGNGAIV